MAKKKTSTGMFKIMNILKYYQQQRNDKKKRSIRAFILLSHGKDLN